MKVTVNTKGKLQNALKIKETWSFNTDLSDSNKMKLYIEQQMERKKLGKLIPKKIIDIIMDCNATAIRCWINHLSN